MWGAETRGAEGTTPALFSTIMKDREAGLHSGRGRCNGKLPECGIGVRLMQRTEQESHVVPSILPFLSYKQAHLQESGHQAVHLGLAPVTQAGTLHHQGFIRQADPVKNLQGGGRGRGNGCLRYAKMRLCVGRNIEKEQSFLPDPLTSLLPRTRAPWRHGSH